jgi:hypothetical protein
MIWKALFGFLGLGSFLWLLHGYGFAAIAGDVAHLGWWAVPLMLSFLPTVLCYALAWLLITPELAFSHLFGLCRLMLATIAWNNLSPFVKVLGEPVRVRMLQRWLDPKAAARSMVLYNIVHSLGTLSSFFFAALALIVIYPVSEGLRGTLIGVLVVVPVLVAVLYALPHLSHRLLPRSAHRNRIVVAGFWVRWAFSKIRIFARKHPARFWAAVLLEVIARFVEGATFFVAFRALGLAVAPAVCALLDVGRALVDNVFFFVPYQVGSREGGILLLAQHALGVAGGLAVSAAVFYRLVEVFWTGVGYLFWIQDANAAKSSQ